MSIPFEILEAEILKLPNAERSQLLDRLIASLETDAEIQLAWAQEAERRDAEIDSGRAVAVPLDAVIERLHAQLR